MKTRLGILISGTGSNFVSIAEACQSSDFPAKIAVLISNRADARGLAYAREHQIPYLVIDHRDFTERKEFESQIHIALKAHNIELVCLAGFMRILSPYLVQKWPAKILNIHPSLLPLFPGLHTHQRALDAGVLIHGCTVHHVSEELDAGPILGQASVPVRAGESAEVLGKRVLKAEHLLYPEVIQRLCQPQEMIASDSRPSITSLPIQISIG